MAGSLRDGGDEILFDTPTFERWDEPFAPKGSIPACWSAKPARLT